MPTIRPIQTTENFKAKRLIYEIAQVIFPVEFPLEEAIAHYEAQGELHDMDDIQASYFQNGGIFLVMVDDESGQFIGSGAIRRLEEGVCELKRLWFRPAVHGSGLSGQMLARLMEFAREKGYHTLRLKTHPEYQTRAVAFYTRLGFKQIPFYGTEDLDDIAMELKL